MKNTLIFLAVWAVLASVAIGIVVAFLMVVMLNGIWYALLAPVAMFLIGVCFAGISWASYTFE